MLFSLERSAVWVYIGHSRFDALGHWDNSYQENDLLVEDLTGRDLTKMRFAMIYGCWSAHATEADWPEAFRARGADCALGWREAVSLPAAYDLCDHLFRLTCIDGLPVSEAVPEAVRLTELVWLTYTGVQFYELLGDARLVPPGYAE